MKKKKNRQINIISHLLKLQNVVRPYTFFEERKVSLIFALMIMLMDVINPKLLGLVPMNDSYTYLKVMCVRCERVMIILRKRK